MGKLVFAAIVFVVGYALYVTVQRQRRLLPTALAEIVPRAILAVAIGIPALIVLFSIFRIIPAGQVGVKVLFGEVEPVPLREGLNVVWNPLYDIVIMDTRVQKHTTRYDAASKDLQAEGADGHPQRGRDPGAAAGHQVRRAGRHHTVADQVRRRAEGSLAGQHPLRRQLREGHRGQADRGAEGRAEALRADPGPAPGRDRGGEREGP